MDTKGPAITLDLGGRIRVLRERHVLLDRDLATVYGVETRALNQARRRNVRRFPDDFAFQLTLDEAAMLPSRSQTVILNRGTNIKHPPWAYTEHGAIMAASVLSSTRAIEMSVFVVRAFVRLRGLAHAHADLAKQLAILERRVTHHDASLKQVLEAIRRLIQPTGSSPRRIGF